MSYRAYIAAFLTKVYLRLGYGGLTRAEEYSVGDLTKKVYWFNSDSNTAGQCVPFLNTIVMNEKCLEEYSQEFTDYVFLHEYGHSALGLVKSTVLNLIILPTGFLAFISLLLPITTLFLYLMTKSIIVTLIGFLVYAAIGVISSVIFSLPHRLEEFRAEKFAIDRIGIENYRQLMEERRENSGRSLTDKIQLLVLYPPERLIVWLYTRLFT